jgi:hypothetical protein
MREIVATKRTIALTVILLFGVIILLSMLTGYWKTESSKVPAKFAEGEFAGEYNPADIRGSYTFEDIEAAFGVPVEVLAEAYRFAITGDPGQVQPKLFEEFAQPEEGDVGNDSMKFFVSLYTGIPYEPEEDTKLPNSAIIVLRDAGKLGDDWMEYRDRYGVAMEVSSLPESENVSATSSHEDEEEGLLLEIKGKTTFGELYDAGVSEERVKEILGMEPGKSGTNIRDFLTNAGLEFSKYKSLLQAEIGAGDRQ